MSKRVMIILAIGFLAIIAGIFLHGFEVKKQYSDPDPEPEPDEAEPENITDEQETEPADTSTDTGTDNAGAKDE